MLRGLALDLAGTVFGPALLKAQRARQAGVVLLYHRIAPNPDPVYPPLNPSVFEAHCALLKRCFSVVPLAELIERVRAGRSIAGCCALTFDDGYRDFAEQAFPILERLRLPATHFLVLDCVLRDLPTWTYQAARARRVERQAPVPEFPPMLTPRELRELRSELLDWGSHTATHAFLDELPGERIREELTRSKLELETIVGSPIRFLAYPNGRHTPEAERLARECGYEAALAVGQRELGEGTSLYALPRIDVGSRSRRSLPLELSGALEATRRALRGRDKPIW